MGNSIGCQSDDIEWYKEAWESDSTFRGWPGPEKRYFVFLGYEESENVNRGKGASEKA